MAILLSDVNKYEAENDCTIIVPSILDGAFCCCVLAFPFLICGFLMVQALIHITTTY